MEDDMNIFRMNIMRGGGYENTSNYVHRLGGVDSVSYTHLTLPTKVKG